MSARQQRSSIPPRCAASGGGPPRGPGPGSAGPGASGAGGTGGAAPLPLLDDGDGRLSDGESRLLRAVFDEASCGQAVVGVDGRVLRANHALGALLHTDPAGLPGTPLAALADAADRPELETALAEVAMGGAPRRAAARCPATGDAFAWFAFDFALLPRGSAPLPLVHVVVHDVTRQRALEDRLGEHAKLVMVGRLATSVTHDFNNLMMAVDAHVDALMEELGRAHPVALELAEVHSAVVRASGLARQLMNFCRGQPGLPELTDLNATVGEAERLLAGVAGPAVRLLLHLEPALWRVRADRGQLLQVLLNLAANARDAMGGQGTLVVRTANAPRVPAEARGPAPRRGAPHVVLAVSDEGCGMDAETLARAFDLFFTTKAAGRGTGVGLATVKDIVAQHDGSILVRSEPGRGATFEIYLPAAGVGVPAAPEGRRPMTAQ